MSSRRRSWVGLGITLSCAVSWSCVDEASIDNDRTASHLAATAAKDAGRGKDATTSNSDDNDVPDDSNPDGTDGNPDDPGTTDAEPDGGSDSIREDDAGDSDTSDAGLAPLAMSVVPGSAVKAMCSSYGKASGTMCEGYYCGVTQEQIAAETPADTLCPDAEGACNGKLTTAVAKCARDVKSQNPLSSDDELRPLTQTCVYKDADLKAKVTPDCLSCFLDAATCAGDNCLVDCLAGDSKGCDTCRAKNNCDKPVFACAKLPNPF